MSFWNIHLDIDFHFLNQIILIKNRQTKNVMLYLTCLVQTLFV